MVKKIIKEEYDNYFDTSYEDNWEKGGGPDEEEEIVNATFEKRKLGTDVYTVLVGETGLEYPNYMIVNTPKAERLLKYFMMGKQIETGNTIIGVYNVNINGIETKVLVFKPEW